MRASHTIAAYASNSLRPGSVVSNTIGRMHSAMAATASFFCIIDRTMLKLAYFQKRHWTKPCFTRSRSGFDIAPELIAQLHQKSSFQWFDLNTKYTITQNLDDLVGAEPEHSIYVFLVIKDAKVPIACVMHRFPKSQVLFLDAATDLLETAAFILREPSKHIYQRETQKMIVEPIYSSRDTVIDESLVFIMMPFSEPWSDRMWNRIIRPIIESESLEPKRADDLYGRDIMEDIWSNIVRSKLVVADVTGRNANVFYELGLAHAIGKTVLLLTQDVSDIPFDLNRYRHIVYEDNLDGYERLEKALRASIREALLNR